MSECIIYHNPRCSKSRQTLTLLEQRGIQPTIIEYLKTPPDQETLTTILAQLNMSPRNLLRKSEAIYKELNLKDNTFSDEQLIDLMCHHPKLIERPIVICNNKARIGRPPEAVLDILA